MSALSHASSVFITATSMKEEGILRRAAAYAEYAQYAQNGDSKGFGSRTSTLFLLMSQQEFSKEYSSRPRISSRVLSIASVISRFRGKPKSRSRSRGGN